MEKKIKLEEILKNELIPIVFSSSPEMTFNATIRAMKEACKQVLELAAENAKTEYKSEMVDTPCGAKYNTGKNIVDKQSILDVINQIE